MTIPAFTGLNTALRGVQAQQAALDVISHNIANVETPGYSRQEAVFSASPTLRVDGAKQDGTGAQLGTGVDVQSYRRLRDDFLDLQFRAQTMSAGQSDVTAKRLGVVQSDLASGSTSDLGTLLDKFWGSWDTLAANPTSTDAKAAVVGTAQTLAQRFTTLDSDIASAGTQATAAVSDLLSDSGPIKPIATELAQLNQQINQAQGAGVSPNDLLDRRDLLLDQLSRYGQVSVTADPTLNAAGKPAYPGMIQVSFGGAAHPAGLPDHGDDADHRDALGHPRRPARRPAGRRDQGRRLPRDARDDGPVADHLGQQRLLHPDLHRHRRDRHRRRGQLRDGQRRRGRRRRVRQQRRAGHPRPARRRGRHGLLGPRAPDRLRRPDRDQRQHHLQQRARRRSPHSARRSPASRWTRRWPT